MIEIAEDQIEAVRVRLSDPVWRICNLYQIRSEGGDVVPFVPRPEQRKFLERFFRQSKRRQFVPKARKFGMSTLLMLLQLDMCVFSKADQPVHCAVVDLRDDDAKGKLSIAALAWTAGPRHLNPAVAEVWKDLHKLRRLTKKNDSLMQWEARLGQREGSKIEADVSFRGGTPQFLMISEFGPISAFFPRKAAEIVSGAINAVPPGGAVIIETTMEAGTWGEAFRFFEMALGNEGKENLTTEDYELFFIPWWVHPSYTLPPVGPFWQPSHETLKYFTKLEEEHGIKLPPERWAWYEKRKTVVGHAMFQQFPSIPSECTHVAIAGQIYPQVTEARAAGRVRDVMPIEKGYPLIVSSDLGGDSDATALWLVQMAGRDLLWHDWEEMTGAGAAGFAECIRRWEREHGQISLILLPHDGGRKEMGSGMSYAEQLVKNHGIASRAIKVVPMTHNRWEGIDHMRKLFPRSWWHRRCDRKVAAAEGGQPLPSGIGRLEGYRKKPLAASGRMMEEPLHDACSHTADAARTLGEALLLKIVQEASLAGAGAPARPGGGMWVVMP